MWKHYKANSGGSALAVTSLLLDVDDDDAQSSHQPQRLDAQEPEQQPEEHNHHRLHDLVPKVHLAEAHPPQTLVEHAEQSPHPLAVIQQGLSGRGVVQVGPPGEGVGGGSGWGLAAIHL